MKNPSVILIIILAFPFSGCGDNSLPGIYVDSRTGNDRNKGTFRKPVRTIPEVNRRIKDKPSDIFFAGGQEFNGTLVLENIQADDSIPLSISSYGEERATINGGNAESVRINKCRNIRINGLNLKGSGRKEGNTTNGLRMINCRECRIEDIYAEGFQKSGVDLYNCRNTEVMKVTAYGNGFSGINIMGSDQDSSANILIKDCKAENNAGDPTILDNHSGNGILVGVSRYVTIDHCTATNNGWDMPRQGNGPVGIWAWMSDHVVIQYCISYKNRTSKGGKDGGGFDLDGGVTNSLIQYCLSYENEGAGYGLFQYPGAAGWANNVIRYCVSINDAHTTEGAGSFFIWNGSGESLQLNGCYIYNNVAYSSSAPVVSFENASEHENFVFSNNIFIGKGNLINGKNTGSRFLGNVWWSSDGPVRFGEFGNLAEWSSATGQEKLLGRTVGLQADPGLKGPFITGITDPYALASLTGYMLSDDSPLRNRGIRLSTPYGFEPPGRDFFGNSVPQGSAPEPGIHELY